MLNVRERPAAPPALDRLGQWLRSLPPRFYITLALILAVNAIIAGVFLWSRGGQHTRVRMEIAGSEVTVWLDGRQVMQEQLTNVPDSGGVTIRLEPTNLITSLPTPRGLDSLRITELETGEVLYEDGFAALDPATVKVAGAVVDDGHVGSEGHTVIGPFGGDARDVRVDAEFDNVTGGAVMLRSDGPRNGVAFSFRTYRHLDSSLQVVREGEVVGGERGPRIEASRPEVMRSILGMAVRGYPVLLLSGVALSVVLGLLIFAPAPHAAAAAARRQVERSPRARRAIRLAPWLIAGGVAIGAVAVAGFVMSAFNERMPHVPDEVSYIFQARTLASGRLAASPPPVIEPFSYFHPPLIAVTDGKWASVYPFGHPMLLAIGVKLGILWLIPPLVGGATLVLVFVAGRRIYNAPVGLLAAILFAASPFFLMTASNFMSHNTAVLYIAASFCCLVYRDWRPLLMPLLAGIFFGLLLNTRPMTAVSLVLPFSLMLLFWLVPRERVLLGVKSVGAFVAGGGAMLLAYGLYNLATTGSLFLAGYSTNGSLNEVIGFGGAHSVSLGLQIEQTQMASLLLVFNGWPQAAGIVLLVAPFVFGSRYRWDWLLLLSAVAVMSVYAFYEATGLMHGPRYWYEAMPFLALLAARGAEALALAAGAVAAKLRDLISGDGRRIDWAGFAIVYPAVVALSVYAAYDWLHGDGLDYGVDLIPSSASALREFNGVRNAIPRAVEEEELSNALVLVDACTSWQCYGSVFWRNSPSLDGDVVYAKNVPERNAALFGAFPDRLVYQVRYPSGPLVAYGAQPPEGDGEPPDEDDAPRAGDVPTATVEPTATPDPAVATANDQTRREHLALVSAALEAYRAAHGRYPLAEGVQTLCAYDFDSACELEEFIELPDEPSRGKVYWYQSDGESFVLFASMELAENAGQCPDPPPPHLADVANLYCETSAPPPG